MTQDEIQCAQSALMIASRRKTERLIWNKCIDRPPEVSSPMTYPGACLYEEPLWATSGHGGVYTAPKFLGQDDLKRGIGAAARFILHRFVRPIRQIFLWKGGHSLL